MMTKANKKIFHVGLILPLLILNLFFGMQGQCLTDENTPVACCARMASMLMSSGENFTNQDSGCHMSENATGDGSQRNAILTESITFKNIDKDVKFPSESEVDFKRSNSSFVKSADLFLPKLTTNSKIYTLNSSFLI